jgi:pimeloyl-ACP methyl ester carboxylesterase
MTTDATNDVAMGATTIRVVANGLEHRVLEWPARLEEARPAVARPAVGTVVLVHGFMDAAGTWNHVAPALAARGLRVLAPDMRGFGEGPRAPAGAYYHFADYVLDLAEITAELAPGEPLGLVGHSMGGTIVTLFAGAFPERVLRLASLEGLGPPDHPFELGPTRMRAWVEGVRQTRARAEERPGRPTLSREEALRRLSANHPTVPAEVLADLLPHLAEDLGEGRLAWRFDPLHRTTSPTPFFARLFVEFAKKITAPVLFVSGGPEGAHPPDEEERLAAFPELSRIEIAGAGHMMHWTRPADVGELLGRFFAG